MIYYPISVLMLAGIREICVITTPQDADQFKRLLGDGSQWGVSLTYVEQPSPDGLAQAFILAEEFLAGAPSALVLGDNVFFGHGLPSLLAAADAKEVGGTVFGYHVSDPERYGVVSFDGEGQAHQIIEKPEVPPSKPKWMWRTAMWHVNEAWRECGSTTLATVSPSVSRTSAMDGFVRRGSKRRTVSK